jgi:hypothetical protein
MKAPHEELVLEEVVEYGDTIVSSNRAYCCALLKHVDVMLLSHPKTALGDPKQQILRLFKGRGRPSIVRPQPPCCLIEQWWPPRASLHPVDGMARDGRQARIGLPQLWKSDLQ